LAALRALMEHRPDLGRGLLERLVLLRGLREVLQHAAPGLRQSAELLAEDAGEPRGHLARDAERGRLERGAVAVPASLAEALRLIARAGRAIPDVPGERDRLPDLLEAF